MTPGVRLVYIVTRAGLSATAFGDGTPIFLAEVNTQPRTDDDNGEYRVPEAVFAVRAAAERDAHRRELAARELLNPFSLAWSNLDALTSRSLPQLRAELNTRGLATPVPTDDPYQDERNLARWWDTESANSTAALRAELWELFDKVKLYDVQEVPFE